MRNSRRAADRPLTSIEAAAALHCFHHPGDLIEVEHGGFGCRIQRHDCSFHLVQPVATGGLTQHSIDGLCVQQGMLRKFCRIQPTMRCADVVNRVENPLRQWPPSRYPQIEMVYDPECPNVEGARTAIRDALSAIGAPLAWREWDCTDAHTPVALRTLGSPSILVNGHDVGCDSGSIVQADANSCRVYRDECGCICGAPSAKLILKAIASSRAAEGTARQ